MKELYYENQGTNTYLIYKIKEDDMVDSMGLGMLTNNRIQGLAQTLFTQMDSEKFIKYNVSAKVSVSQFFAGAVNRKRLLGVFSGIVNAMIAAEDYMIEPASILLDLDYIFTDVSTCATELICLPIVDDEMKKVDMSQFFRNIMFSTQFEQTENCDYVARIINYLNGTPVFSLFEFGKLLDDIQGKSVQQVENKVNNQPMTQTNAPQSRPQAQTVSQVQTAPQQPQSAPQQASMPQKPAMPPVSKSPVASQSMNVPPSMGNIPSAQRKEQAPSGADQKGQDISLFYLMQHYNKENAATYKAQKKAKKDASASGKKASPAKSNATKPAAPPANLGFAVPNQAAPIGQGPAQAPSQPMVPPSAQPMAPQKVVTPATPTSAAVTPAPVATPPVASKPAYVPPQTSMGQAANFGETTVLGVAGGGIGETTVLSSAINPNVVITPFLIRRKNNEKITLNKPIFRMGKERSYVDYFIGDNIAISRSHANIIIRDGQYFVLDTNSTNHTYVNGTMIQSNVETQLTHGDIVRLANEDFEFNLH